MTVEMDQMRITAVTNLAHMIVYKRSILTSGISFKNKKKKTLLKHYYTTNCTIYMKFFIQMNGIS